MGETPGFGPGSGKIDNGNFSGARVCAHPPGRHFPLSSPGAQCTMCMKGFVPTRTAGSRGFAGRFDSERELADQARDEIEFDGVCAEEGVAVAGLLGRALTQSSAVRLDFNAVTRP